MRCEIKVGDDCMRYYKRAYMGVGYSGYEYTKCPKCGEAMWNGVCENKDCEYHWYPLDYEDNEEEC